MTATGWREIVRQDRAPAAALLLCGLLLHSMNVLLIATVLPSIVADIGGGAQASWPTTAYVAASIIAGSCTGLLVAATGAKRTFVLGAAVFACGTFGCAVAPDMPLFVASRFVQGFGGGLLTATAYVLTRSVFPEALWPKVFALLASVWSVSVLLGPLLGGAFAAYGDWRGAFFTLSAVAIVIGATAYFALPRSAPKPGPKPRPPWSRVALLATAIAAISAASIVGPLGGKLACLGLGFGLAAAMLRFDRRAENPMFPRDAFALRTPTGVGLWLAFFMLTAFSPIQVYSPIFLTSLHGLGPLEAGYAVATASLFWTVAALLVADAGEVWRKRLLVLGPATMVVGMIAAGQTFAGAALWPAIAALAIVGAGIGSVWSFAAQQIMAGAQPGDEDVAATSVATVQQAGGAFGAGMAGAAANAAGFSAAGGVLEMGAAPLAVAGLAALLAAAAMLMGVRVRRYDA